MDNSYAKHAEWAMGNGQCPSCYGKGPAFYPGIHARKPEYIGHKLDCDLAKDLRAPMYLGQFKPTQEQLDYAEVLEERYKHWDLAGRKIMDEVLTRLWNQTVEDLNGR